MNSLIAITGLGPVTPIGLGRLRFWDALLGGQCGIGPVESFDSAAYPVHRGAEVRDFRPETFVKNQTVSSMGRASQFAVAAARLAIEDAGLDLAMEEVGRVGVSMGTTSGEPGEIERLDDALMREKQASAGRDFISKYPCHKISTHVAREFGITGVNSMIPTACAAGNYAVAYACDVLASDRADVMLAGGADAFSRITYAGFSRLGAIAPEWCQPFDRRRKGMIPGEGACVITLEKLDRARARGARVYAVVSGYGLSCDAHHLTGGHPQADGAVRAMTIALQDAQRKPEEVSYISAHGTGTLLNDKLETLGIKRVFGDAAYNVPISSIKSMIGHTMGAASAIEAGVCALAVSEDRIPPTIHMEEPDPECDLDYVPNEGRELTVSVAMSNAYAFGGNNASLLFEKVPD